MERALIALAFGAALGLSQAQAADMALDVEGECRLISEPDLSGCRCRGLYYESKFGPGDGAAALHLVGRSYVPEPRVTVANLYERFGADRLARVAGRVLETHDEVLSYCPFSAHDAD